MATVNLGRIKPVFRGAYNNSTAYVIDDIVTSGNETFIAIAATQGNATTDASKWTKLAAKGSDGTDVAATLANKEIAFKTNAGALDGIPIGNAGEFLKVNSGATGYEFGSAGGVLQMVHAEITNQPSRSTGNTYADISGLNVTLTPASTSNKILICFDAGIVANDSRSTSFILKRAISGGATTIHGGTGASNRQAAWVRHVSDSDNNHDGGVTAFFFDTTHNTTSAITYTVQWISQGTAYLNRAGGDGDNSESYTTRTHSRIWAQEIGV